MPFPYAENNDDFKQMVLNYEYIDVMSALSNTKKIMRESNLYDIAIVEAGKKRKVGTMNASPFKR